MVHWLLRWVFLFTGFLLSARTLEATIQLIITWNSKYTKPDFIVLIAVITGKQICPTRNELKIILACNSTSVKNQAIHLPPCSPNKVNCRLESLMRRNIIIIDGTKFWSSCQGQDAEFVWPSRTYRDFVGKKLIKFRYLPIIIKIVHVQSGLKIYFLCVSNTCSL